MQLHQSELPKHVLRVGVARRPRKQLLVHVLNANVGTSMALIHIKRMSVIRIEAVHANTNNATRRCVWQFFYCTCCSQESRKQLFHELCFASFSSLSTYTDNDQQSQPVQE